MAEHTPGPWTTCPPEEGFLATVLSTNPSYYIAAIYDTGYPTQNGPNARLIAAAPDLLAALQRCVTETESIDVLDQARDAIAKATGEAGDI